MATILLTGISGAIGTPLAKRLTELGHTVIALVRRKPNVSSQDRAAALQRAFGAQIRPLFGDVLLPGCGVTQEAVESLVGEVDACIHAAGATQYYEGKRDETFATNLGGTEHACALAEELDIKRFAYISTCYVGGNAPYLGEEDAGDPMRAHNPYEASKIAAERVVQRYLGDPLIIRLSTVIGRIDTGEIVNAGGYAGFVAGFAKLQDRIRQYAGHPFLAAVNPNSTLNLVTNEWVTEQCIRATLSDLDGTVHLAHPRPVSMRWLFEQTFHTDVFPLPVSFDALRVDETALFDERLWCKLQEYIADIVTYFWPYVTRDTIFGHERVKQIPGYEPPPDITAEVIERQMHYMVHTLFARREKHLHVAA